MFFSYRDCFVTINNKYAFVNNAVLSWQANVSPSYIADSPLIQEFVPVGPVEGTLRLNYLLTGKCPLKEYMWNESGCITGNFGGMVFQSGYLRSYSLEATPNAPIEVQAEIVFYDDLTGSFSPRTEPLSDSPILNFRNVRFNGVNLGDMLTVTRFSYTVNNSLTAHYEVADDISQLKPERIVFGERSSSLEITLNNLSGSLPLSGSDAQLSVLLSNGFIDVDSFNIRGPLVAKQITSAPNEIMTATLVINQQAPLNEPFITALIPYSGAVRSQLIISGGNFSRGAKVYMDRTLLQTRMPRFNEIVTSVPLLTGGLISVETEGGIAYAPQVFRVLDAGISGF